MISQKNIDKGKYWEKGIYLVEGCTKVSAGCKHCWSEKYETNRRKRDFNIVNPRWDRIKELGGGKPKIWAIWNDLFHEKTENQFIWDVFDRMKERPGHIFLTLTKRPERMPDYYQWHTRYQWYTRDMPTVYRWSKNLWLGTSCENQEQADKRIPYLLQTPAAVRYLSVEPMLSPITLVDMCKRPLGTGYLSGSCLEKNPQGYNAKIDWVIIGAESGANKRECKIEWVRDLVEQCKNAGVPVFIKQLHINGKLVKDINLFPPDLRLRQYPKELKNEH